MWTEVDTRRLEDVAVVLAWGSSDRRARFTERMHDKLCDNDLIVTEDNLRAVQQLFPWSVDPVDNMLAFVAAWPPDKITNACSERAQGHYHEILTRVSRGLSTSPWLVFHQLMVTRGEEKPMISKCLTAITGVEEKDAKQFYEQLSDPYALPQLCQHCWDWVGKSPEEVQATGLEAALRRVCPQLTPVKRTREQMEGLD